MAKRVALQQAITLGGHDISEWVARWAVAAEVGNLIRAEVDIIVDRDETPLRIEEGPQISQVGARGFTGAKEVRGVLVASVVTINGTDISSHIEGWSEIVMVGKPKVVRLLLQADKSILSINDTAPWEENRDGTSEPR